MYPTWLSPSPENAWHERAGASKALPACLPRRRARPLRRRRPQGNSPRRSQGILASGFYISQLRVFETACGNARQSPWCCAPTSARIEPRPSLRPARRLHSIGTQRREPMTAAGPRDPARPHLSQFDLGKGEGFMRIAQLAPLHEAVPPRCYGGTERVVDWLCRELTARHPRSQRSEAPALAAQRLQGDRWRLGMRVNAALGSWGGYLLPDSGVGSGFGADTL